eukprot:3107164-Pyramimonas_sp.AAC.1
MERALPECSIDGFLADDRAPPSAGRGVAGLCVGIFIEVFGSATGADALVERASSAFRAAGLQPRGFGSP